MDVNIVKDRALPKKLPHLILVTSTTSGASVKIFCLVSNNQELKHFSSCFSVFFRVQNFYMASFGVKFWATGVRNYKFLSFFALLFWQLDRASLASTCSSFCKRKIFVSVLRGCECIWSSCSAYFSSRRVETVIFDPFNCHKTCLKYPWWNLTKDTEYLQTSSERALYPRVALKLTNMFSFLKQFQSANVHHLI